MAKFAQSKFALLTAPSNFFVIDKFHAK